MKKVEPKETHANIKHENDKHKGSWKVLRESLKT